MKLAILRWTYTLTTGLATRIATFKAAAAAGSGLLLSGARK
jgi:hypothetical protein